MKKIVLLVILLITTFQSFACDICGCNSGSYFIGPFPQFNRYFISMQYSIQQFNTVAHADHTQFSRDYFQTTELMTGTSINNRWQLLAFFPYHFNRMESDDGIENTNGLGDVTLIGNYNLLDNKFLNKDTVTVAQQLWIGIGVKFPTGRYSIDTSEFISSANMQPGTGSLDFLINAFYSFRIEKWGFNLNSNYSVNQQAYHFRFGNRLSISLFAFRNFNAGKLTISPNLGLLFEDLAADSYEKVKVMDTGGYAFLPASGLELKFKNISIGGNLQFPLISRLSGGQTNARLRAMLHWSYIF